MGGGEEKRFEIPTAKNEQEFGKKSVTAAARPED
jgi:hypothetical protein